MMNSVPTCSAWACICSISQGPWIDLGEARIVLDVGRDGHLPAGLVALDDHRLEHGARGIDGGGVAGGPGAQDDDFGMLGGHGWQNPGGPRIGTNPELIWERYRTAATPGQCIIEPRCRDAHRPRWMIYEAAEGLPAADLMAYGRCYEVHAHGPRGCGLSRRAGMHAALGEAASGQRPDPRHHTSNQLQPLEAGVALAADDDVVVDGDAERLGGIDDLLRHVDVGAGGRGIARGVVVHQDDGAGR